MKRSTYYACAGLGVAAALLTLLTVYQISILTEGYAVVSQAKAELSQAQSRCLELSELSLQEAALTARMRELNTAMPTLHSTSTLINDLHDLTTALGSELRQVRFSQPVYQEDFVAVPVTMELITDYSGLLEVMDYLQYGPQAMRIDSIKVQDEPTSGELKVDITAASLYSVQ